MSAAGEHNTMTSTRLQNLPVSFFSSVMGLAGLAIALQRAGELWAPLHPFGLLVAVLSALVFIALTGLYAAKLFRHRAEVVTELTHPVKMSFGATFSVSLVLLSVAFLSSQPALSFWLWAVGAGLHLVFTLYVLSAWIHKQNFDINHISPAWFIPVVGNILVPVAGVAHASAELSWFFFSIGLLFWIVLFTIIVYRMIFHNPLPDKLLPTLFILIAPPAVGFISYIKLTGDIDSFARVLYYGALFLTLLLFKELPRFVRLPFYLSWWAYSFPLAAMTVATLIMQAHVPSVFFTFLSWVMVVVLDLVILYLLARTLVAVSRQQICVEGH
ncbi:C4-dicarboxylate ABC transporter [Thiohalobacter thiocyanaticus]|uniref:C4-dicarboxylate ABC transporter n=2 Tax=Thiohalobacter thiocyanaticus TaxID=585455 RepID=A0A1Z4VPI6_9GAMM|nr:C4-dicarboxylate ABC transporter [Thiohalobacter thiocyanaticus]